jgi:hypothetical protein
MAERITAALILVAAATCAIAGDLAPKDYRSLAEVRTLKALPADVVALLGQVGDGPQGIADAGQPFNRTEAIEPHLPARRFIVAGSNLASVLAAYEQGGRELSFHAKYFVLERSGWKQVQEWTLSDNPVTLFRINEEIFPNKQMLLWTRQHPPPTRRDGPLRRNNISDEEVRQVQAITGQVMPGAIVHISGVVVSCPCADGSGCTDQVWIVAYRPERSRGLQLSKIGGYWTIGPVQQWWLDYEDLQASYKRFTSYTAFSNAQEDLLERFPVCDSDSSGRPKGPARAGVH